MREIKFRGLTDKGIWVYGLPSHNNNMWNNAEYCYAYKPETLGQYTGLKDKNGKEIYKGDLVSCSKKISFFRHDIAKVVFYNGCFMIKSIDFEDETKEHMPSYKYIKVVGNIYENPELLNKE